MEREEGSEPIVVINGKAEREALGTTLGDLFRYYPNSYLIERPHDESSKKKGSKTATENGHPKDGVSSAPPLVIRQADYKLKSHCVYELKTDGEEDKVDRRLEFHEMVLERLMKVIDTMQPVLQSLPTGVEEADGESKKAASFQAVLHNVAYPEDSGAELKRLLMDGVDKRLESIFTKNISKIPDGEKLSEGKALLEKGCYVSHLLEKYLEKEERGDVIKEEFSFLDYLRGIALTNTKDFAGNTVFINACLSGHLRVVTFMLSKRPEVLNQPNDEGRSPFVVMILAAERGTWEVKMNQKKYDEFMKSLYMRPDLTVTPEEMPIVRDFEENLFVRITKEQKGKSIDPEAPFGESDELVQIMMQRNTDVAGLGLGYFLRKGLDMEMIRRAFDAHPKLNINVADFDGNTALAFAISHKESLELVPLLLAKGADANLRDADGRLPIFHRMKEGKQAQNKLWNMLFQKTDASTPTNEEIVELFLHHKKKTRREKIFKGLKVNPNMLVTREDYYGANSDSEDNGEDSDSEDEEESLPERISLLTLCLYEGQDEEVAFLLEHGADVNQPNEPSRTTPIFHCDTSTSMELLIKAGADVNWQNAEGRTPLMVHARKGKYGMQMVRLLLKQISINKGVKDSKDKTALDYAKGDKMKSLLSS